MSPALTWPSRLTEGLADLAANTRSVVFQNPKSDGPNENYCVQAAQAVGNGMILEFEPAATDAATDQTNDQPEPLEFAFLSFPPEIADDPAPVRRFARLPGRPSDADLETGTIWQLYLPDKRPVAGVAILLGGNKYVRDALLSRDWAVLSTSGPGRYYQRRARPAAISIDDPNRIEPAAEEIARIFDDELAEWAYATEAALSYLEQTRPELPRRPAVLMGFSVGALVLPAVATRLPDRFEAAALVAGGADMLLVSRFTSKEDRGLELSWGAGMPSEENWEELDTAYLRRVSLDSYHTAATLSKIPVLAYHAAFDQVVPARTGELLKTRLGKVQYHVLPVGHKQLLRLVMQLQAGRVADWIEEAVRPADPDRNRCQSTD